MMTAQKDHYKVLGLDKKANEDEVKRAYRSLAKQFHPDKNTDPGAEEKFKEIGAAYDVLKDEQKRRTYDMQRDTEQLRRNNEKMRAEKAARDASTAKASSHSTPKTSHREEQAAAGPSGRQYSSSDRSTRFSFFTSDDEEAGQSNAKRKGRRKTTAGSGSEQQQNAQRKQQGANMDYTYKLFSENVLGAMLGNLFGGMGHGSMPDSMFSGAEPSLRQTSAPPGTAGWDGGTGWEAPSNFMFSSSIPMPSMYTMGPGSRAFFSGPQSSQDFFTESQTAQTFASGPQRSQRQQRREQEDDMADMYDWSKPMWTEKPKRGARSGHRRGSSQPSGSGIRCSYCGRGVPAADLLGHEEVCRRLHGH